MSAKLKVKWPIVVRSGSVIVKIYHTPRGGYDLYTLSYHEGARRVRKYFPDLSDARAEAKNVAEKLSSGQGAALQITGKDRDAFLYAKRKLAPLGVALVNAIDEYVEAKALGVPLLAAAQHYHRQNVQKIQRKTVSETVNELIKAKEQDGHSVRYLADLRSRLGRFSKDFQCDLIGVDTASLEMWLREMDIKGRTRNNYARLLQTCFRWARAQGYLPKGVPTAADELQRAKNEHSEIGIFSPGQFAQLLNANPTELKVAGERCFLVPYFVLGGFCGLRHAEINRLAWSDVNLEQKFIRVGADKSKTASNRLVPLCDSAVVWLARYVDKGQICSDRQSKYARGVAEKLEIPWPNNALRHSYASYRLAQINDDARVALEMGNSRQMLFRNYRSLVTGAEAETWFSITPETAANVIAFVRKTG